MANVFISHSSLDKPFVRRLALGLIAEGIPIWLDSWSLELGDSLLDKIYEGITESSIVILIMSRNAVESGWVNRELNAALSKEDQIGRKFLIPIRIDECQFPLKIADRIYADFSSSRSFSEPLSKLVHALTDKGARDLPVAPHRELVGLSFTREVHLEVTSLERAWDHVRRRHENLEIQAKQVVINNDPEYEILLQKLHANIDNIASHPNYSPSFERHIRRTLGGIQLMQKWLAEGVAALLSHNQNMDALYWFAKIVRGQMVYALWSVQFAGDVNNLEYGRNWSNSDLGTSTSAPSFFGVEEVKSAHVHKRKLEKGFHLWIGAEECRALFTLGVYTGLLPYYDVCGNDVANKYVFPQMMFAYLRTPERTGQPIWDLNEAMIGID